MRCHAIFFALCFIGSCASNSDINEEITKGYYYTAESRNNTRIYKNLKSRYFEIAPSVVSYKLVDKYLICKQIIIDPADSTESQVDPHKSLLPIKYWIINTATDKISGPLDSAVYMKQIIAIMASDPLRAHS